MKRKKLILFRLILAIFGGGIGLLLASLGSGDEPGAVEPKATSDPRFRDLTNGELSPGRAESARFILADETPLDDIEALLAELHLPAEIARAERLLLQLAASDGNAAICLFEGLKLPDRFLERKESYQIAHRSASIRAKIIAEWAKFDPAAAQKLLQEWRSAQPEWSLEVDNGLRQVVLSVLKYDLGLAGEIAVESGLGDWFENTYAERPLAEDIARLSEASGKNPALFGVVLGRQAIRDPDAVIEALLAMPKDTKVGQSLGWLRGHIGGEQLVEIHRHFSAEEEGKDWSSEGVSNTRWGGSDLQDWARVRAEEALAWVEKLPEEEREHFRAEALVGAAMHRPQWAIEQMESLSPKKWEQAAVAIVPGWLNRDPAAASAWMESVEDVDLRERLRAASKSL